LFVPAVDNHVDGNRYTPTWVSICYGPCLEVSSSCTTFWIPQIFLRLLRASSATVSPRQPRLILTWYLRLRRTSRLSKPSSMAAAVRLECTWVTSSRLQPLLRRAELQLLPSRDLDPSMSASSSRQSPKVSVQRSKGSGRKQLQRWLPLPTILHESCSQPRAWRSANRCRGPRLRQDPRYFVVIYSIPRLT
jgi:hypothetical protein